MLKHHCGVILAVLVLSSPCGAQRPQDNWYLESTMTKTSSASSGGLSAPTGIAIGTNDCVYVADAGLGLIQAYHRDGEYWFSFTNRFGPGDQLTAPGGMITDPAGNLYVASTGSNCVYVFTATGQFIRKIGGIRGTDPGQLLGVIDVAVATNGDVFILESQTHRVSVFSSSGAFQRCWGGLGYLDGLLVQPKSIAIGPNGFVYIAQSVAQYGETIYYWVKVFDQNGIFQRKFSPGYVQDFNTEFGPMSVRVDPAGRVHVMVGWMAWNASDTGKDSSICWSVYHEDGTLLRFQRLSSFGSLANNHIFYPCHAVAADGTMILCSTFTRELLLYRSAYREQWVPPRNAIPLAAIVGTRQRSLSPLVDIDYRVTDADDTNITAAVLIFTNGTQSVSGCLRNPTFVEGTATNIGGGIAANQEHRLTWNAGSDWATTLGSFRVAVLARDSRTNLLDIHYLRLPADRGMPQLKISRSPLLQNDFMQVWWWQLATNDPGIQILSSKIYGVSGIYSNQVLNDGTNTTALGRGYIYQQMHLREATAQEVAWAKEASTPGATNVWGVTRSVGGRPAARNEYGFDTGVGGTNVWWVVPQP